MPQQLSFDLPTVEALGREDYFVSNANAAALAKLETATEWDSGKCLLFGPEASGKTHLAHVWAAQQDANLVEARDLSREDADRLTNRAVVVENVDTIAGHKPAEEILFHLHNRARERRVLLLMTTQLLPARLKFALPDLQSRLQGTDIAELQPPDDALLAAVLLKQFADRQIAVSSNLIPYLLPRMERSFSGVRRLARELDKEALATQKPITRDLARRVLDNLTGSDA